MSLTLECINEQEAIKLTPGLIHVLEGLLLKAGEKEGIETGEVTLSFVDDGEMQELNKTYRNIDASTDVLSFAILENDFLGDIIISAPKAIQQSAEYGHSLEREIGFLFIHGFLHLMGYDHQDEASEQRMFAKQELILQEAGLTR